MGTGSSKLSPTRRLPGWLLAALPVERWRQAVESALLMIGYSTVEL